MAEHSDKTPQHSGVGCCASGPVSYGLVIHGGAGEVRRTSLTPKDIKAHRGALEQALLAGEKILKEGGTAIEAVQAAVVLLEDAPYFNAGKGSVFTHDGTIEMDASIMDGATLEAGAVARVKQLKNPILAAQKVLAESKHVMLTGDGAEAFAAQYQLETVPPAYFETDLRRQQLEKAKQRGSVELDHGSDQKFGTVGAVALDKHGNLAAATSTGGMTNKRWGRVGDSPIIAAGTYAKNATCAVSSTGHGEYFIRAAAAHAVSARMEFGKQTLKEATDGLIFETMKDLGGKGGVIAIDAQGNIAMPFNTEGMYRGWIREGEKPRTAIWK